MKRLGFRPALLSTEEKADAGTKRPQTTEPQLFYIVCVPSMGIWYRRYQNIPEGEMRSIHECR
jgi:hypothetical protein